MKGQLGWPAGDGDQVIGRHRQSRHHRMSVQAGTQRYCGEDLPRNPSVKGRGQVAHGVLHENYRGHNPRTCRKLRNLVDKNKGSGRSAAKRLVAPRNESACRTSVLAGPSP